MRDGTTAENLLLALVEEIKEIVLHLKNKLLVGWDEVSVRIIRFGVNTIAPIIFQIIN